MTEQMNRAQLLAVVCSLFKSRHIAKMLGADGGTHSEYLAVTRHFIRRIRKLDNVRINHESIF
jgi:hypothetical protein